MTAKYISASLLTVLRIAGKFIPGYINLVSRTCTMTNTKTAMSKKTDRRFNLGNGGGIRKSGKTLTEGEREGYLDDYRDTPSASKT